MELHTLEFGRTFIMVSESDSDRCAQAEMVRFKQIQPDSSIVSLFNIFHFDGNPSMILPFCKLLGKYLKDRVYKRFAIKVRQRFRMTNQSQKLER